MIRTMALALLLGVAAMGQARAQSPGEAPGSSFASHRTWKPLQMPRRGPPAAANSLTAVMTGENCAMAPVRR